MHAARPGSRDSLRLTLPDIFPLCLGHIAQKLKHNIRNQRSGQIVPLPCVEQGHVEHHDIHLFLFCENPPLLQNFIIIPAKPVDALDDKRIARLELFDQALIDRTLKILARLLLLIDLLLEDAKLPARS